MTTVVGPILGPILGGTISDNWSWHWIFFINIPVGIGCALAAMRLLKPAETATNTLKIDMGGLVAADFMDWGIAADAGFRP